MATVGEYVAALPAPLGDVAARARATIDAELGDGRMWHGHPVWMVGTTPVALLKAYSSYVTLGLFQGQLISDESGRLEPAARQMASLRLRSLADIDEPLFRGWLRQARERLGSPVG
jgi:hypothetical protein